MKTVFLPLLLICAPPCFSQQPAPVATPAPQAAKPAAQPAKPAPSNLITMTNFERYAADDARLIAKPSTQPRVVLMGDSITEGWSKADPGLFAEDHFIDRGISGQTTMQMLLRFRPDVIDLHPAVVVILGGTNDIAQNAGVETLAMIENNLTSMAELAQANHIAVVFSSITPADHYWWHPGIAPAADIHTVNEWMQSYASEHNIVYLDYFSALAAPNSVTMPKEWSADGVHPTATGFRVMRPLMEKAVQQAMQPKAAE